MARRDVYVGRSRIAIMQSDVGDTKEALANMRQALALCEADAALNPDSTEIRSDLGIFHFRLAEMLQKLGRNREALGHLEKTLQMEEALSAASPKDMNLAGNVAEDWKEVSDLHMSLGDTAAALAGYQKSAEMWGKLVAANPEDVDGQNQLALALQKLGAYYGKQANTTSASTRSRMRQEARNWYQKSLEKWQKLEQARTLDPEYSKNPETVRRELAALAASLAEEP
ncbi:MAG TPA: tetratricopeptide repeat protein [Terriglobales bacterium]|nr:tetratricopeptide repeat protein [Terriglobales bacterium]